MTNISEMTNAEINDALAIEVMGWRKKFFIDCDWWYEDEVRPLITTEFGWQPCADLNQAVGCAEKIGWYPMIFGTCKSDDDPTPVYSCYLRKFGQEGIITESRMTKCYTSPARALCEAVLMAVRGEGKG